MFRLIEALLPMVIEPDDCNRSLTAPLEKLTFSFSVLPVLNVTEPVLSVAAIDELVDRLGNTVPPLFTLTGPTEPKPATLPVLLTLTVCVPVAEPVALATNRVPALMLLPPVYVLALVIADTPVPLLTSDVAPLPSASDGAKEFWPLLEPVSVRV